MKGDISIIGPIVNVVSRMTSSFNFGSSGPGSIMIWRTYHCKAMRHLQETVKQDIFKDNNLLNLITCIIYNYRMEHSTKIIFKKNVRYVLKVSTVLEIRVKILLHVLSGFTALTELAMTGNLALKELTATHLDSRNNLVRFKWFKRLVIYV